MHSFLQVVDKSQNIMQLNPKMCLYEIEMMSIVNFYMYAGMKKQL